MKIYHYTYLNGLKGIIELFWYIEDSQFWHDVGAIRTARLLPAFVDTEY